MKCCSESQGRGPQLPPGVRCSVSQSPGLLAYRREKKAAPGVAGNQATQASALFKPSGRSDEELESRGVGAGLDALSCRVWPVQDWGSTPGLGLEDT